MATTTADPVERSGDVPAPRPTWRQQWKRDAIGLLVVTVVVLIGYAPVAFGGKTFSSAQFVEGARVCPTPTGACTALPANDPRPDLGASAWALETWGEVVHRDLAQHDVPLWNPYQGIGAPLAANFQSAVFDPALLPWHLDPTPLTQDLSFLLGLVLIGASAYFAARMIRLGVLASVLVGSVFPLTGWFFAYSNNQWFRIYLYLPLLIGLAEWIIRSHRRLAVALFGIAVAGMLAVGMPEPAFIGLFAAAVFGVVRSFVGERADAQPWKPLLRLAGAGVLGLLLAAPLLLVAAEYLPLSFNVHKNLGDAAPATDPLSAFLNWMMPRISANGPLTYGWTRNWVGAGTMLLAAAGLGTRRATRSRHAVIPLVAAGAIVTIQIYGGALVGWTRHIPLWSNVLWPPFGTPVIAFVLAMLAGVGVQALVDREIGLKHVAIAFGVLALLSIGFLVLSDRPFALTGDIASNGGWLGALLVAVLIVGAAAYSRARTWIPVLIVAIVIAELLFLAPRGIFGDRTEPYPQSALTTFLQEHTGDGSRIFSTDGVLFTNSASAYGLSDPRMLDALYVERYLEYVKTFVSHGITDRLIATGPTESAPNVASNQMFDLLGVRYLLYRSDRSTGPPSWAAGQYRFVDEIGGVRIYENTRVAPRAFVAPIVKTVGSEHEALAYLVDGEGALFPDSSIQVRGKDLRQIAVVESDTPVASGTEGCTEPLDSATVVSRSSDEVSVDVDSRCGGLLVLTDQYYPGWTATVDGESAPIHATDTTFRGVSVPAGKSHVVFRYAPSSFKHGLLLFGVGLVVLLVLLVTGIRSSRWWRRRREGSPAPDGAAAA